MNVYRQYKLRGHLQEHPYLLFGVSGMFRKQFYKLYKLGFICTYIQNLFWKKQQPGHDFTKNDKHAISKKILVLQVQPWSFLKFWTVMNNQVIYRHEIMAPESKNMRFWLLLNTFWKQNFCHCKAIVNSLVI